MAMNWRCIPTTCTFWSTTTSRSTKTFFNQTSYILHHTSALAESLKRSYTTVRAFVYHAKLTLYSARKQLNDWTKGENPKLMKSRMELQDIYTEIWKNIAPCAPILWGIICRVTKKAADTLKRRGFDSVEFITTRNTTKVLEEYSDYLQDEGFTVTFGSEHNTPAMEPIKLRTSDHPEGLSEKLRRTNFRGACKVVAHQAGLDSVEAGEEIIMKTLNN